MDEMAGMEGAWEDGWVDRMEGEEAVDGMESNGSGWKD